MLIQTTVANVRWLKELVTNLFFEVGADFIAQVAGGASASALGFVLAKIVPVAIRTPYTTIA